MAAMPLPQRKKGDESGTAHQPPFHGFRADPTQAQCWECSDHQRQRCAVDGAEGRGGGSDEVKGWWVGMLDHGFLRSCI